jgi:hypothetical protein
MSEPETNQPNADKNAKFTQHVIVLLERNPISVAQVLSVLDAASPAQKVLFANALSAFEQVNMQSSMLFNMAAFAAVRSKMLMATSSALTTATSAPSRPAAAITTARSSNTAIRTLATKVAWNRNYSKIFFLKLPFDCFTSEACSFLFPSQHQLKTSHS